MSNTSNTPNIQNVIQVSSPLSNQLLLTAPNLPKPLLQANPKHLQPVPLTQVGTLPPINLVTTPVATLLPQNQKLTSTASPNSTNVNASSSYGGFAHCNNCGEYGVKAAFYGKSKLYCSVACQNGIKKQQQQQTQGIKRTIESLNYSSSGSATNSPLPSSSVIIQPATQQIAPNSLALTNKPQTQVSSNSDTPPQVNQVYLQLSTNTGFIQPKSEATLVLDAISLGQHQPTAEPIQLQPCTDTDQIQNNQIYLIKPSSEANTLEVVVPNQQQVSQINNVAKINGNVEPSSKRPRNNSNGSSNSTITTSSVNNQITIVNQTISNDTSNISVTTETESSSTFEWSSYIDKYKSEAAPVSFFKHAPLSRIWSKFNNLMVEVPVKNLPQELLAAYFECNKQECFWFAKVVQTAGYLVKLRYFGASSEASENEFWMHMCDDSLHPVGWTSENDFNLVPPESIVEQCEDWRDFCLKELVGYKTLPNNFKQKLTEALSSKFKTNMLLEVVNKHKLSTMRVARVLESKGGRLRLKYENSDDFDDFYCSELSELIHPIGWSAFVGHDIIAPEDYKKKSAIKFEKNYYEVNECSPGIFKEIGNVQENLKPFKVGMKLEAIDPLNLSAICVATVARVLRNDYIMIKIDGYSVDDSDIFCYHRSSSSILPAGFCQKNSITLKEPFGYKGKFKWKSYLNATNSEFAPYELFNKSKVENPFKVGMKIESVDLMTPKMICVATVIAVVDRLIRIHFDGWEPEYDQWVDCESCSIYPVGWCQLVDHRLHKPGSLISEPNQPKKPRKKRCNS